MAKTLQTGSNQFSKWTGFLQCNQDPISQDHEFPKVGLHPRVFNAKFVWNYYKYKQQIATCSASSFWTWGSSKPAVQGTVIVLKSNWLYSDGPWIGRSTISADVKANAWPFIPHQGDISSPTISKYAMSSVLSWWVDMVTLLGSGSNDLDLEFPQRLHTNQKIAQRLWGGNRICEGLSKAKDVSGDHQYLGRAIDLFGNKTFVNCYKNSFPVKSRPAIQIQTSYLGPQLTQIGFILDSSQDAQDAAQADKTFKRSSWSKHGKSDTIQNEKWLTGKVNWTWHVKGVYTLWK